MESTNHCKIHTLPDSFLLQILSLLPIQSAVQTSVLSKRWSRLWSYMPAINFNEDELPLKVKAELVTFINRFLLCHVGRVRSFNLSVNFARVRHIMHVDRWIRHLAVTMKVEEISISLDAPAGYNKLHLNSFYCSSIVTLKLKGCYFESPLNGNAVLGSLKNLSLQDMALSGLQIMSMLQSCPLLECLNMENCSQLGDVKISLVHLVSLTIMSCKDVKFLVIGAPCLQYCKFHCHGWEFDEGGLTKLLEVVTHLKTLRACGCFFQALSGWQAKIENYLFCNLKEFILLNCAQKDFRAKIPFLLLNCSPGLRSAIFSSEQCFDFFSHKCYALSSSPTFKLPQLQNLKIQLFNGITSEVQLLEYFANHAPLLERITITFSSRSRNLWGFVTDEALCLQRSHPHLVIEIAFIFE